MSLKKRNKYFVRDKALVRLRIEDKKLRDAIRNQNLIELDKPIHDGFTAEWVLRDDILNREDAHFFQEALDACKESLFSRREDFKFKDRYNRWYTAKPKLKTINKEAYGALSVGAKKFYYETKVKSKHWQYGYSDMWYTCTLSYELVMKIKKHYKTHVKEHDEILYQMDSENEYMMNLVSNYNPWGGSSYMNKFWRRHDYKQKKTIAMLELKKELNN